MMEYSPSDIQGSYGHPQLNQEKLATQKRSKEGFKKAIEKTKSEIKKALDEGRKKGGKK